MEHYIAWLYERAAAQRAQSGIPAPTADNKTADSVFGYIIAFSFGKGAIQEAARLKLEEKIVIELITVDKIVPIAHKPRLTVAVEETGRGGGDAKTGNGDVETAPTPSPVHEITFTATGESAAGIEFYSWDFNYDAEKGFRADVMLDREGVQTLKLKAGQHIIAAKVVDNDGLENIESIRLKVNGKVEVGV
jgi:hypothetical protein